ncbi:hypothetical protein COF72_06795 [Bacillus pseudomycoides]|uniref:DUF2690 domain-containing protein n=1 Tax=Bacillus pseudomycoides TaxID=64104 RepID=UPI000BFB6F0A|nr:DUF2690 domain-containing protein [Bacillus pseudomycoides]PHF49737.1 hypothetical protein COF72_06795 [Bacillus pseudomycoides]
MKALKKWATMIGAVTMLVSVFSIAAPAPKVAAAVINGSDPIATGCARDAKTVGYDMFSGAEVELRYSPSCRSAWAKFTIGEDPAAKEGTARITRNDGVSYSCTAKKSLGQKSCYTKQVNDAGYTARATANALFQYQAGSGYWWEILNTRWY